MQEDAFQDGVYRGRFPSSYEGYFGIWAQRGRFDEQAWNAHAQKFFQTQVGFSHPRNAPASQLDVDDAQDDAAWVVVASKGVAPGRVWAYLTRKTAADDAKLAEAEQRYGLPGMLALAQRCSHIFWVPATSDVDRTALTLAAMLASLYLGPILPPSARGTFGVQSARRTLASLTS
jgi:hypothetical protein